MFDFAFFERTKALNQDKTRLVCFNVNHAKIKREYYVGKNRILDQNINFFLRGLEPKRKKKKQIDEEDETVEKESILKKNKLLIESYIYK